MKHLSEIQRNGGRRRPPPSAMGVSLAVHGAVVLVALLGSYSIATPAPPRTYRVQLVAAADEKAPEREKPAPPEPAKEEHRPPPPEPTPERRPETKKPTVKKEEPPPRPVKQPPARAPEKGEEEINVQLDGAVFPFPAYLNNIIRQVNRYWRPPTGGRALRAEIAFTIQRDGSVTDIEWKRRSGEPAFDLEARGAIEAAGRNRAFGPLPEGYPRDRLRVSFYFDPSTL